MFVVPEKIAARPFSVAMLCDIVVISFCTGEITAADAAADVAELALLVAEVALAVAEVALAVADVALLVADVAAAVADVAAAVALDAAAFWLAVADAASTTNAHLALSVFVVRG
tara:strand:+ start:155 stop:496 length:342 start_codon:yes stop_codon:yes gene_type:complete